MKKFVSLILSFMLFLGVCPKTLAAGINKVDVLSDGTVLTYISTERIQEFRQALLMRISKNRDRNFSTSGNLAMKAASATAGALLCWAESYVENDYLRGGLIAATAIISLITFFYPEYVRYDVDQVENHRMKTELNFTTSGSYDMYSFDKREGLNGLLDCIDQCITDSDTYKDTGIIVVERPYGFDKRSCYPSGVYKQNPYDINSLNSSIDAELRDLNR